MGLYLLGLLKSNLFLFPHITGESYAPVAASFLCLIEHQVSKFDTTSESTYISRKLTYSQTDRLLKHSFWKLYSDLANTQPDFFRYLHAVPFADIEQYHQKLLTGDFAAIPRRLHDFRGEKRHRPHGDHK